MLVASSSKWLNITAIIQDDNFKLHSLSCNYLGSVRHRGHKFGSYFFFLFFFHIVSSRARSRRSKSLRRRRQLPVNKCTSGKDRPKHRIKISNRRATQRCNVSAFFYAKICSLLARRRSRQPVQRVYWPENVIDWLGKWRPTCVMRHARGQKLQSFRRKWPFYMDLYSMAKAKRNPKLSLHKIRQNC